jgi:FAD:protein FMN transferase
MLPTASAGCSLFTMSRCVELRRARPLLGTFVEIHARASIEGRLKRGIDAAFAAIGEIHRLMSFHDLASDVSRLNGGAFRKSMRVHAWTWEVLTRAQDFAQRSGGAFDITIAPLLSGWGYLPHIYPVDDRATFRDVILKPHNTVRFRRRLSIDLGGIAKGFAVDRAVECLRRGGLESGVVNAGGDLRAFGSRSQEVYLRDPTAPGKIAGVVSLRNRAIATSGVYFTRRTREHSPVSPLVNGRSRQPHVRDISAAVSAAECVTADALTKVVLAQGDNFECVLRSYDAEAVMLERGHPPRLLPAHAPQLR